MYVVTHSEWPGMDGVCVAHLWTVGYHTPAGKWEPESDHGNRQAAQDRANLLNGVAAPIESEAKTPELVGLAETAALLGWSKAKVSARWRRGRMPVVVAGLACGPIWLKSVIEQVAQQEGGSRDA